MHLTTMNPELSTLGLHSYTCLLTFQCFIEISRVLRLVVFLLFHRTPPDINTKCNRGDTVPSNLKFNGPRTEMEIKHGKNSYPEKTGIFLIGQFSDVGFF